MLREYGGASCRDRVRDFGKRRYWSRTYGGITTLLQDHFESVFAPCNNLRNIALFTPQRKLSKVHCETERVASLMKALPRLRRFTFNEVHWDVSDRHLYVLP